MNNNPLIVSIGEVVWDVFPDRRVLGGAPVNVAYHLGSLGLPVRVISRIGSDELGNETLVRLADFGLLVTEIQVDRELPTGMVTVSLNEKNEPHFQIVDPAAWDNIDQEKARQSAGDEPFHLVFGSLAQRHPQSRSAIRNLWQQADQRFYDVNLRPPFTPRETVLASLEAANVVKLNTEELGIVAAWLGIPGETARRQDAVAIAVRMHEQQKTRLIAVTDGPNGAWLISDDGYFEDPGFPVTVADTVGAGDAFFAALINSYLNNLPWQECLVNANRLGAYVASQYGATPRLEQTQLQAIGSQRKK